MASVSSRERESVKRVTLTVDEVGTSLGVSRDHFERHIVDELRETRFGRRLLVRLAELERGAERREALERPR